MRFLSKLEQGSVLTQKVCGYFSFIAPLITRIVVGAGFYMTGQGKIAHIDRVIEYFKSLNIPYPQYQAPFVARLEYYGGILLVLGLFVRPISFLLAGSMTVAMLTADKDDVTTAFRYIFGGNVADDWSKVPTDVTSFAYWLLLVWLVLYGAGALSLDKLFGWLLRRGAKREDEPTASPQQ